MTGQQAQDIREWFTTFTDGYRQRSEELGPGIVLKIDHTLRVVEEMDSLTTSLKMGEDDKRIANIIALLHDVGRFPQIEKYGTMSDRRSENHALLGVHTILENRVLDVLSAEESDLILTAITNHNMFALPEGLSDRVLHFSKLIRDSDKLDIWRVMIAADDGNDSKDKETVFYAMNEGDEVSPEIIKDLVERKVTRVEYLKTRNDFRLLVLGWVFDLQFCHSFEQVQRRQIIETFEKKLPETADVKQAIQAVRTYLDSELEK